VSSADDLGFWWVVVDEGRNVTVHGHERRLPPRVGESIRVGGRWVTVTRVETPPAHPYPVIHARRRST
jgi:hypothetical protein